MKTWFLNKKYTLAAIFIISFMPSIPLFTDYILETNALSWDLFSCITTMLHSLGISLQLSYKLVIFIANIACSVISYISFLYCFQINSLALIGSMLYSWCPARINVLYIKGNFFELLLWCLLPLTIASLFRLSKKYHSTKKYTISLLLYFFSIASSVIIGLLLGRVLGLTYSYGSEGVNFAQYFTIFFWGMDSVPSLNTGMVRVQAAAPGFAAIVLVLVLVWAVFTKSIQTNTGKLLLACSFFLMLASTNTYPINRFLSRNLFWTSDDFNMLACSSLIVTACYTLSWLSTIMNKNIFSIILLAVCGLSFYLTQFMTGSILTSRRFLREESLAAIVPEYYPTTVIILFGCKLLLILFTCIYVNFCIIRRAKNDKI